ncbi:DMT family transporter [Cyanobium gracile UHCC 0139]|uniref:DMT family transporter n=1 Tax=Cyanobium gracile UHCC 0139 TaxID=3110308 RepID=A0ABU5RR01_9CYAN|nr:MULTISPECIES: DMT family transporter [Cyanobium]MCP9933371.1 DMT family transporter [Cyanobium sp. Candia 9D4]MEA5390159.1 DMT family transporter [Cyanobium gracile UHCC 0139]
MNPLSAVLCAFSAGSLLSLGGAANARLGGTLRSAVAAATVNFLVGAAALGLLLGLGGFRAGPIERLAAVPPWALGGGMLGALYVTLSTLVIPRLGLTATTMTVVCSQLVGSLLIDHWGWLGVPQQPNGPARWLAVLLLLVAVALRRRDG